MRILFLAEAPSPYAREWAAHLASAFGHEVHLASLQEAGPPLAGVTLHPLGRRLARLGYAAAIPAARRLGAALSPDVVIAYRVTSYGVLAAAAGLHPLVLAAQGQHIAYPPASGWKRALARYALGRADLVLSWGAHMARNMVKLGCDPEKIRTVAYGIDVDRYAIDTARARPGNPPRLLSTRAMRRDYNQEQMLRALPEVAARHPGVIWTALGEGPERERLARLAGELRVARNLDFPGRVSGERLLALLQASDVYLSAVATDGVSASLLEAMACGAWPVVTDNAANRLWIRPGVTGDLVPAGDARAMARAILGALADPGRAAAARAENRALVADRASLWRNMALIDEMLRAVAARGLPAVPPVPASLVVPPPAADGASREGAA
ncbi:MAG: glycosyltransferase family 4 protein [Myxococcota bacterium]